MKFILALIVFVGTAQADVTIPDRCAYTCDQQCASIMSIAKAYLQQSGQNCGGGPIDPHPAHAVVTGKFQEKHHLPDTTPISLAGNSIKEIYQKCMNQLPKNLWEFWVGDTQITGKMYGHYYYSESVCGTLATNLHWQRPTRFSVKGQYGYDSEPFPQRDFSYQGNDREELIEAVLLVFEKLFRSNENYPLKINGYTLPVQSMQMNRRKFVAQIVAANINGPVARGEYVATGELRNPENENYVVPFQLVAPTRERVRARCMSLFENVRGYAYMRFSYRDPIKLTVNDKDVTDTIKRPGPGAFLNVTDLCEALSAAANQK